MNGSAAMFLVRSNNASGLVDGQWAPPESRPLPT